MEDSDLQTAMRAFHRAIAFAGGRAPMGAMLGMSDRAVGYRIRNNVPLKSPAEVEKVEAATGVSRHDLRPDLYPREDTPRAPAGESPQPLVGGPSLSTLEGVRP